MSNFKFRLQKVLDIKIRNEENSKIEHAKALKAKVEVQNELEYLRSKYTQYSNMQDVEDIVKRKIIASYLNSLYMSIDEASKLLEEKQKILNDKQQDLIQKQVERKSLEKLKEKDFIEFNKNLELKEQLQNDEYALQSYFRAKNE